MNAPGPGEVLFGFVRYWSRRARSGDRSVAEQGRLVLATESVAGLLSRGERASVNAVADEIGVDQSVASRLMRNAADAGYVTMTKAPSDGRGREATVTPKGRTVIRQAHEWQERVFDELTVGWSQQRRDDFQAALAELIERSRAIDTRVTHMTR
ncbi:MarR family winged helix-turn-helix transcriptional regulator [Cumulibacter soli]|uniref:MarR family winged helix-turn-helix transcriptional regulator n=1 Tax=Cumulibacter soli TaxID=2546344 RepID=UPI0010686316|nr:MarR family winged helix-turn-helix transcriptional regulator [Cumulibacter soli]